MVKSPAALVPCCKTIPPLWEAVEFPLSMVQMTPACKRLTEMFLDSVSAAGRGRGRGWERGVVASGCYFHSLGLLRCPFTAGKLRVSVLVLLHLYLRCQPVAAFLELKVPQPKARRCRDSVCRIHASAARWISLFTHLPASSLRRFVKPG